jgi:hypothetical protein
MRANVHVCFVPLSYQFPDPEASIWLSGCTINPYQNEEIDFESGNIFLRTLLLNAISAVWNDNVLFRSSQG